MFWHDIKDIKEWMVTIAARLTEIQMRHLENEDESKSDKDDFEESIGRLHDKLNTLLTDGHRVAEVAIAQKTLDKFEDYMKNVDKLNEMINEFKGTVSLARAAIAERKEQQKEYEDLKDLAKISKKIFESMQDFIRAGDELEKKNYFKLDAIYRKICEIDAEKPKKKGNSRKKTTSPES